MFFILHGFSSWINTHGVFPVLVEGLMNLALSFCLLICCVELREDRSKLKEMGAPSPAHCFPSHLRYPLQLIVL
jgi:hypothetical protein